MSLLCRGFAVALVLALGGNAQAANLIWPNLSGGACSGSLQDCVTSAAAGDTISIVADELILPDRYTAINENITITRSLTLAAAPGIDAVFAEGRRIIVQLAGAATHTVTISDLTLRRGNVLVSNNGGLAGTTITVQRLRVNALPDTATLGCGVEVQSFGGAIDPLIIIGDNVLKASAVATDIGSGICVSADASVAQLRTNIFRNRVLGGVGSILNGISTGHPGAGVTNISANTVLGPNLGAGIRVQRAVAGLTRSVRIDNNVVVGQSDQASPGIQVQTSDTDVRVVNNTVAHGIRGIVVTRFNQIGALTGRIANNIVAFHSSFGYTVEADAAVTVANLNNLSFANPSDLWVPGPGTLNVDPQFRAMAYPSLLPTSPAIDGGDLNEIPSGVFFDADGERRVILGQVDMGAYESNSDQTGLLIANLNNAFFNEAFVDHFANGLSPTDNLVVTAIRTEPTTVGAQQNLGVYQNPGSPSGWSVFHQNVSANIAFNQRFSVMSPVNGRASLRHLTDMASVSANTSRLDHPELNARPFAIAVATHFWQGTYHDFPIGMQYSSAGGGRWFVRNENAASPMPAGQTFHVVIAPLLSSNAMRTTVGSFAVTEWPLEHPMLADTACASPIVGRADDPDIAGTVSNTTPYTVGYRAPSGPGAPGRWFVLAETGTIPANAAFHLIVDGHQINRCRANASALNDALFSNGFE